MDINLAVENLQKNRMKVLLAKNKKEAKDIVTSLIPKNSKVGSGGSLSLQECGITDLLNNGDYVYYDRSKAISAQEKAEVFEKEKQADVFLSSSNAITLNGELYNVDGRANRVSCIAHGPKSVIIVAGKNKVVKDLDHAILRIKTIAAPRNAKKLNYNTYCLKKGRCQSLSDNTDDDLKNATSKMTKGCFSDERICCSYLITGFQRIKDRITVILVDEDLGY